LLASLFACDEEKPTLDPDIYYSCTEMGCVDGLLGRFQPELQTHGEYVFTLDVDGMVSSCSLTLPLVDSESCEGSLQITRSGSAMPASDHSFPFFNIYEIGFSTYTLTVERDGAEVVSWTEEPEWELLHPNGEECEPTCEVADTTVVIP